MKDATPVAHRMNTERAADLVIHVPMMMSSDLKESMDVPMVGMVWVRRSRTAKKKYTNTSDARKTCFLLESQKSLSRDIGQ